jgi:acyl-CoA carboxylase subunit beta
MSPASADASSPPWLEDFTPAAGQPTSRDPLSFPGYRAKLAEAAGRSGSDESVVWGRGTVDGRAVVAAVFRFDFMGGSMGEATGARLVAAIQAAASGAVPLVSCVRSGGARMQEGMHSLVQMQTVAGALADLRDAGVPHICVAAHPTTGGVWASFASAADVVLAHEGAMVAFAGTRVRDAAEDGEAFLAAGKLASGAVDVVVDEESVGSVVGGYVRVLGASPPKVLERCPPPVALPGATEGASGWQAVLLARDPIRPRAHAYLDAYFDERVAFSGDRVSGHDPQMLCGVGLRSGVPIAYVAQAGGANTAAGFRTAIRTLRFAERRGLPVLTLIDTPGAQNGADAESEGIGSAIAQTFGAFARAKVPVTTLVVGEGGSGGALGIAAPGNLWMVPSSFFAVIAPEGAAAILYRDRDRASSVADEFRLSPSDLMELGIARGVVAAASDVDART